MKLMVFATAFLFASMGLVFGQSTKQNEALEQEIRKLELAENDAILRNNVADLEKLWAEDFTVNNPQSQISRGRKEVLDRVRSGLIKYSSFVREIESIGLYDNTAIVMGLEVVTPIGNTPGAGQTIRRRFTDIWMKRKGGWQLTARHANVICQK